MSCCGTDSELIKAIVRELIGELIDTGKVQGPLRDCEGEALPIHERMAKCDDLFTEQDIINITKIVIDSSNLQKALTRCDGTTPVAEGLSIPSCDELEAFKIEILEAIDLCKLTSLTQAEVDAATNKTLIACVDGNKVKVPFPIIDGVPNCVDPVMEMSEDHPPPEEGKLPLVADACDGALWYYMCQINRWVRLELSVGELTQFVTEEVVDPCEELNFITFYDFDGCSKAQRRITLSQLVVLLQNCGIEVQPTICELPSGTQDDVDNATSVMVAACVDGEDMKIPYQDRWSLCGLDEATVPELENAPEGSILYGACVDGEDRKVVPPSVIAGPGTTVTYNKVTNEYTVTSNSTLLPQGMIQLSDSVVGSFSCVHDGLETGGKTFYAPDSHPYSDGSWLYKFLTNTVVFTIAEYPMLAEVGRNINLRYDNVISYYTNVMASNAICPVQWDTVVDVNGVRVLPIIDMYCLGTYDQSQSFNASDTRGIVIQTTGSDLVIEVSSAVMFTADTAFGSTFEIDLQRSAITITPAE